MGVIVNNAPGLRNDLLVAIPRSEIEDVVLHIANRDELLAQPGYLHHGPLDPAQRQRLDELKLSVEEHLIQSGLADRDGQQVLRSGQIAQLERILADFYDVRYVRTLTAELQQEVYRDFPHRCKENLLVLDGEAGAPRSRDLHNAVGFCPDNVYILQRERTIEEVAQRLREAGARDGFLLDSGGSVACWAWWLSDKGGYLFSVPHYRLRGAAILALVLRGPLRTELSAGSPSSSVI